MFGKSNGQLLDEQLGVAPSRETKSGGAVALQHSGVAQPGATPETPETISTLGPGMAIIGKIACQGTLHIFGRIEGELRASNVLIGNGAQFDGNVIAQGVTIDGRLKGTIYATRVSLQSNAVVDGDIFHRVLSIDENTFWASDGEWTLHEAALCGSSHYDLPGILRWFTANVGVHHIHHLCSRIPYYRLPKVLRDHPELRNVSRLTIVQSLRCVRLVLWDEARRRLISFREMRLCCASHRNSGNDRKSTSCPQLGDNHQSCTARCI